MNKKDVSIITFGDSSEKERRNKFIQLLRQCPVPEAELMLNMGLFLTPQNLSRILFMDFLFRKILEIQGVIMEFGCRWGQSLVLFSAMRGIYEPFNRLRKIVGFDTFSGFPSVSEKDGGQLEAGGYSTTENYDDYLDRLLTLQEEESPLSHLKKFEIVKGDATKTISQYLERNPETIVALAYFDLDIYKPTQECLLAIKDRLTRGSVVGFDELNDHASPGETLALKEVLGLDRYSIKRFRYNSRCSYLVID
jgi:hypothetical protein